MRSSFASTSQSQFVRGGRPAGTAAGTSPADPEIARLFTELRRYLGHPIPQIAHHIAAHPGVIAALEAGRIDLLPPWSETARVVTAYIALAQLDPRPALSRLSMLMGVSVPVSPPPASASGYAAARSGEADVSATPVARILGRLSDAAHRAREQAATPGVCAEWAAHLKETGMGLAETIRSIRAPVRWVSAAAIGLIIVGSAAPSGVLQASVGGISQPISGLWAKLSGQGSNIRVIIRDGLKWIEADDPRERRSDKLPSRGS